MRHRTPSNDLARRALQLALCFLTLSGCHSVSVEPTPSAPRHGGTVVVGLYQEPAVLNPWLASGGLGINVALADPLRDPWIQVGVDGAWKPRLAAEVPTPTNGGVRYERGGMRIAWRIRPGVRWSDGVPITCSDWRFTWRTIMDDRVRVLSRLGWELVTAVECPAADRVVMRLREPYAPYRTALLAQSPLPEHELAGRDFNTVWASRITVSSGPFEFREWKHGVRIVYGRNPNYWNAGAERRPYLDRLVFVFLRDANTLKVQLRTGEIDMTALPPDTNQQRELSDFPGIVYHNTPGGSWEQLAMQTERGPLADVRVRRAVAYSIDRRRIVGAVLKGQAPSLDSTIIDAQRPYAIEAFARYRPSDALVRRFMGDARYRLVDGRWTREGRPIVLRFASTTGNPVRLKIAQLLQQQLREHGFDMTIAFERPDVLFGSTISRGRFDLGIWAWSSGSDPSQAHLFACDQIPRAPNWQGKNDSRYCNPQLDDVMRRADRELDVRRRIALVRDVQRLVARDVPTLPLFRPPDAVVHAVWVRGYRPNPVAGVLWNVENWWSGR